MGMHLSGRCWWSIEVIDGKAVFVSVSGLLAVHIRSHSTIGFGNDQILRPMIKVFEEHSNRQVV